MAIAIDTLADARRLREAGFTNGEGASRRATNAEGQAQALALAMTDTLANKQDLSELETRLQAGISAVKHEVRELELRLDVRFADLERRTTLRLGAMLVAGIGVVSGLVAMV